MAPLRIGTLGAARITPPALTGPAVSLPDVEVVAVAARERERAKRFAGEHGIPQVHDDYAALLADTSIDAVYNPLPISLHHEWTIRALRAGKHVLCEKPFASNAREAREMAECAEETGRVLFEAFHYRYHPLAKRVRALLDAGAIGRILHLETRFEVPIPRDDRVRWGFELSGGCTMDVGCYTLQMLRFFGPGEPEVVLAVPELADDPRVDAAMKVDVRYADGATGHMSASMTSKEIVLSASIRGSEGTITAINPVQPQLFNKLVVETADGTTEQKIEGEPTFHYQLRAFADAVLRGAPVETDAREAVRNMELVGSVYAAAGLPPRGGG
jgi:predicted dehydrogenase